MSSNKRALAMVVSKSRHTKASGSRTAFRALIVVATMEEMTATSKVMINQDTDSDVRVKTMEGTHMGSMSMKKRVATRQFDI